VTKTNPREIAILVLAEVMENEAYSNISLREKLSKYSDLTPLDKAFITEIVHGTIRYLITIDYIINQYSKTKINKMKPLILNILRCGVYQIIFMTKVPSFAACNESVEIAKRRGLRGLSGFVNGVLRNIARNSKAISYPNPYKDFSMYLSVYYSYPKWLIDYWLDTYSPQFVEDLCRGSNKSPVVSIRCNTLKTNKEDLMKTLSKEDVVVYDGVYSKEALGISKTSAINELPSFKQGLFQVQDESSMLVGHILNPKPRDNILDVCSAPGGKATHCGELMKNEGIIFARDIHEHKLDLIKSSAQRLGISIIKTQLKDATQLDDTMVSKMDRVLIDAPCLGLGIIRKKPDIKYKKTPKDLEDLIVVQRQILSTCSKYVNVGGILVYSTCTISKRENIENIDWFTRNFDFELEDIDPYLPETLRSETSKKGYIQLYPHIHNIDGFFIARLRRKR